MAVREKETTMLIESTNKNKSVVDNCEEMDHVEYNRPSEVDELACEKSENDTNNKENLVQKGVSEVDRFDDKDNTKKKNVDIPKDCRHDEMENYQDVINNKYFVIDYYDTVNYPVYKCVDCAILFGSEYKASAKQPVRCCENAKLSHHTCTVALCTPCYCKKFIFLEENNQRKRRLRM